MDKIIVTRKIPQPFIEQLEALGQVEMWDESLIPMPRAQFLDAIKDATACFITLSEKIDEEALKQHLT